MTSKNFHPVLIKETHLPTEFSSLVEESILEGHNFVKKTLDEWNSGKNQFNRPSECFYLAYIDNQLVGCCGLNLDPYTKDHNTGRIRHLYVSQAFRRKGIAKKLTNICLDYAKGHFQIVRLRANQTTVDSFKFYEAIGFERSDSDNYETHRIAIKS